MHLSAAPGCLSAVLDCLSYVRGQLIFPPISLSIQAHLTLTLYFDVAVSAMHQSIINYENAISNNSGSMSSNRCFVT